MGAISALSTTSRTLKRNGVLFAIAFVVAFVSIAPSGLSAFLSPSVGALLSLPLSAALFFIAPFFLGGMLSMAAEGIDGTTGSDTFVEGGKANYLQLFGAMILVGILFWILASIVTIGVAVVGVFAVGLNSAGAAGPMAGGSLGIIVLLGLVGGLLMALPVFFLQFYAPAVVVSDLGIVDSLKRSAGVVRRNFVSTLGYSAVAGLVGVVAGLAGFALSMASGFGRFAGTGMMSPGLSLGLVGGVVVVSVLVSTFTTAFGSVYQVAFYDECLESLD